jgi:hypothetical protein
MAEARAKVSLIYDPRPLENEARIIWCVLQCHTIMRSFVSLRFQEHPVIVKEITMFMVTEWVDPSELDQLRIQVVNAEATVKESTGALLVPECLWEEHLLHDCPTPWVLTERTRLRGGIRLLRKRMLGWWKRKITTSFLEWIREEHP